MKNRLIILLLLATIITSAFAVIEKPKADESIEIATLQKYQITKTYNDTVTWKSNKPLVASVNKSGVITGVSSGSAKITGTYKNGNKQVINVKVLKKSKTSITAGNVNLNIGESKNIGAITYPASMKESLTYTSSNILVAKVDATGKVTGLRDGSATITITAPNLKTKKVTVTVGSGSNNNLGGNGGNNGSSIFDTIVDPVSIKFNEPNDKNVTRDTVVSIKFNLTNNDSGNYYYVWNTYTDDIQNYDGLKENGCQKLGNEKNKTVTLTMSKTNRYGEVVIYSDTSCKNKITSKKTSTYTIKSSDVSVNLTSNVNGTKVDKNSEVKITGIIKNNSKGVYYYRWQDYKNGSKLGSATSCTKINKSSTVNVTRILKISDSGIKTKLEIYTDSSCSQKFKEMQSNTYDLKSSNTSSIFDLLFGFLGNVGNNGTVNIKFTPSVNKTTVDYNTVVDFNTTFTNTTDKDYYYKWYTYTGTTQNYADSACQKIVNGGTRVTQLAINSKNRSGKFVIYSDSTCGTEYKSINTSNYSYEGDFADFKKGFTVQKIGEVTVITEKGCNSSKVNSMLEALRSLNSSNLLKNLSTVGFYTNSSYPRSSGFGHTIVYSGKSKTSIKLKCDVNYSNEFYKESVVHEVGHSLDGYYKQFINYRNSNNNWYGISYSEDVSSLYNYYKNKNNRPLRDYAYENEVEFWAESFACYYNGTNGGKKCSLPTTPNYNLKSVVENYVNVLKSY